MLSRLFVLAAIAVPSVGSASLMTMTFDNLVGAMNVNAVYVEDGITATGTLGAGSTTSSGFDHIDFAGPNGQAIDFTTGRLFTAESVMIQPRGSGYCAASCTSGFWDDPVEYMWFSGFLENSLVSSMGIYRPLSANWELLDLALLGPIDMLRIEARSYRDFGLPGFCSLNFGCGQFNVDNLRVNSVPEPGTLLLLSGGLVGVALTRRRRRGT